MAGWSRGERVGRSGGGEVAESGRRRDRAPRGSPLATSLIGIGHRENKKRWGPQLAAQIEGHQIGGLREKFGRPTKMAAHLLLLLEIDFSSPPTKSSYDSSFALLAGVALIYLCLVRTQEVGRMG